MRNKPRSASLPVNSKQLFSETYSTQQTTVIKSFPNFLYAASRRPLRPISKSLWYGKMPLHSKNGSPPDDVAARISIQAQLLFI